MKFINKAARQDYLLKEEIEGGGDDVIVYWDNIENKPSVIAAGDSQEEAREAIGAGTSNFGGEYKDLTGIPLTFAPEIGDSATTAMAGNTPLFSGNYADLSGIPSTFPPQIGTTPTTAKAGDYSPPDATTTVKGLSLMAAAVADATDDADVVVQFNTLLANLRAAGILET